jgi:hypothetical protein
MCAYIGRATPHGQFEVLDVTYTILPWPWLGIEGSKLRYGRPVNAITNKFWFRCKASSVTTPATVNEIWLQQIYNCLMLDPQFTLNAENYKRTDYSLSFAQQENP